MERSAPLLGGQIWIGPARQEDVHDVRLGGPDGCEESGAAVSVPPIRWRPGTGSPRSARAGWGQTPGFVTPHTPGGGGPAGPVHPQHKEL
eukprot:scaffold4716_cov109-Isochrysis_galbana.AAC.13